MGIDDQDEPPLEPPIRTASPSRDNYATVTACSGNSTTTSELAAIPPELTRRQTTPGAICVPGLDGAIDDNQHDNLLDMDEECKSEGDNGACCQNICTQTPTTGRGYRYATSASAQSESATSFTFYSTSNIISEEDTAAATEDSITISPSIPVPIVAELAPPNHSYNGDDIEERLVERLEAQISLRLRHGVEQEFHRRLFEDPRRHAIAQVVNNNGNNTYTNTNNTNNHENMNGKSSYKRSSREDDEENFKICGIRRTWWGMILCVVVLLLIGGLVGVFLWFSHEIESNEQIDDEELFDAVPSRQPSFVPSAALFNSVPVTENFLTGSTRPSSYGPTASAMSSFSSSPTIIITQLATTKEPTSSEATILPTNTPSSNTSALSPAIDRRWEYLITNIGKFVVPDNYVNYPENYFVTDIDDARYAAMGWMAFLDLETDIFNTPVELLVQRYVLAVLYYSTGGIRDWEDKLHFLTSKDVCHWNNNADESKFALEVIDDNVVIVEKGNITDENNNDGGGGGGDDDDDDNDDVVVKKGVFCDSSGSRVSSIKITNNSLQGEIPWELSLLENLIEIHFDANYLYGSIPTYFGRLGKLQGLWLPENKLSGTLPIQLSKATELKSLDLENNTLTFRLPSEWGSLTNLFYIGLRINSLTGTLPLEWQYLTSLQVLDLDGNNLSGTLPEEYGKLFEIKSLYFESNQFEGSLPLSWGNLTNLVNFFVDNNVLSGTVPPDYNTMANLEYFWFNGNDFIGSVDEIFCVSDPSKNVTTNIKSNCKSDELAGTPAQIKCSCCTTCCDRNGTDCVTNI